MVSKKEQEIRKELMDAIDKAFQTPALEDFGCWYGKNHLERMADAALAVLMATKEAQELMKDEGVNPL